MKKQTFFLFIVITILAMLFLAACGSGATQTPTSNQDTGSSQSTSSQSETTTNQETSSNEPENSESETNAEEPANGEETTGGEEPAPEEEGGLPADVPIIEGAYDIAFEGNGTRIRYKVDLTNQEVAEYYQTELSNMGWNKVIGADSVIGNMGSISRDNDRGDRLVFGLSYNPTGLFTSVTIDIIRAP